MRFCKRKDNYLALAVTLATSFASLNTVYAADSVAAVATEAAGTAATTTAPAATPATTEVAATTAPATTEATQPQTMTSIASPAPEVKAENGVVDEQAAEWAKKRPQETAVEEGSKGYEGQTIVDTVFEGTTELTEKTAKAALTMRTGDMYTTQGMAKDREAVYNTGYFYDLYPTFEKVPEGVILTYHVLENPVLTEVSVTGNTVVKTEDIMALITLKTGEILNSRTLQENVQAIQELYRKDGYILAKITDLNVGRDGKLKLKVNEGILEGYKVKGNTKTKDRVVLREMRQKVGEPFNSKQARRSMQRVYNLGFFEDVNIKMNPGVEPNAVIMEIDVKEKNTGSFGIGAGYSSQDGVIGMISLGDTNFRGTGDAINISYEVSGDDTDAHGYSFSYRRPWLDSKETAGTLRIYNRTYEYDDYDTSGNLKQVYMRKYSGGEVTVSRPVSEYSTNFITLRNRKDDYVKWISDEGGYDNYDHRGTQWYKDNFGRTCSITLEHVTDTRDNIYSPTEGGRVALSLEQAGLADFEFTKFSISDQRYRKAGRAQVFATRAEYGVARGELTEFNEFKIGGQSSLRGFREDQFDGRRMALLSFEYRFPIVKKVQGALFTDWGAAWDDGFVPKDIHGSIGVGLSLNTPLGPLRLDYGRQKDGGRVHFTVGGSF